MRSGRPTTARATAFALLTATSAAIVSASLASIASPAGAGTGANAAAPIWAAWHAPLWSTLAAACLAWAAWTARPVLGRGLGRAVVPTLGALAVLSALPHLVMTALQAPGSAPVEASTLPIAIGALIAGLAYARDREDRSSWATLAPGILLALVPSYAVEFSDAAVWRLVLLGALSVLALVWGAVGRLQAPFAIGAGMTALHALATFWPLIARAYQAVPWWLWLGVAGILLIFIAATYEARLRDARRAVRTFRALR